MPTTITIRPNISKRSKGLGGTTIKVIVDLSRRSSFLLVKVAGGLALVSGVVAATWGPALVIGGVLRGVVSVRCLPVPHTLDGRVHSERWAVKDLSTGATYVSPVTDLSTGARFIPRDTLLVAGSSVAEQVMAHGENLLIALCVFWAGILLYRLSRSVPHDSPSARRYRVRLAWLGWICVTIAVTGPLAPYFASSALFDRVGFSGECRYSYSALSVIPAVTAALLFAVGAWVHRTVPASSESVG